MAPTLQLIQSPELRFDFPNSKLQPPNQISPPTSEHRTSPKESMSVPPPKKISPLRLDEPNNQSVPDSMIGSLRVRCGRGAVSAVLKAKNEICRPPGSETIGVQGRGCYQPLHHTWGSKSDGPEPPRPMIFDAEPCPEMSSREPSNNSTDVPGATFAFNQAVPFIGPEVGIWGFERLPYVVLVFFYIAEIGFWWILRWIQNDYWL
ncbi:hypothetical protein JTE90_018099 [Oedothorax gibbosus]|uniref:Uncharacterized protein n=1 Tax=Oedothorax gibbosus TaxID=931172 RepID=A0AAV6UGX5_9ARAC|nr:hypothetical protein JTE90_018099 [Oedothorax gibbosus]